MARYEDLEECTDKEAKAYEKKVNKAFPKNAKQSLDALIRQIKQLYVLTEEEIEHDEFIGNIVGYLVNIHPALTMQAMIQHWYEDAGLNARISQMEAVYDDTTERTAKVFRH